jgi:hypothetical protein
LRLLRLQPRLLDDTLGGGPVLLEEGGERLGGVEHRLQADVDQALLAERRLAADPRQLVAQPGDDRGRRPDGATMPK